MAEHIDYYRTRRAKPGQGTRKAELLKEFWFAENAVTHAIIAYAAGNKKGLELRQTAEDTRDALAAELVAITKD